MTYLHVIFLTITIRKTGIVWYYKIKITCTRNGILLDCYSFNFTSWFWVILNIKFISMQYGINMVIKYSYFILFRGYRFLVMGFQHDLTIQLRYFFPTLISHLSHMKILVFKMNFSQNELKYRGKFSKQ